MSTGEEEIQRAESFNNRNQSESERKEAAEEKEQARRRLSLIAQRELEVHLLLETFFKKL